MPKFAFAVSYIILFWALVSLCGFYVHNVFSNAFVGFVLLFLAISVFTISSNYRSDYLRMIDHAGIMVGLLLPGAVVSWGLRIRSLTPSTDFRIADIFMDAENFFPLFNGLNSMTLVVISSGILFSMSTWAKRLMKVDDDKDTKAYSIIENKSKKIKLRERSKDYVNRPISKGPKIKK